MQPAGSLARPRGGMRAIEIRPAAQSRKSRGEREIFRIGAVWAHHSRETSPGTTSAMLLVVTGPSRWRVTISMGLAVMVAVSSMASLFAGPGDRLCEREHHSCARTLLTEGCCKPATMAAATPAVLCRQWSSLTSLHLVSTSWIDDVAGVSSRRCLFTLAIPSGRSSPISVPAPLHLIALLI